VGRYVFVIGDKERPGGDPAFVLQVNMPLLVRRSRLEVSSDSVKFPAVSGFNLNRQELEFPRDFRGDLNLLFVPFLQPQQVVVNTWIPFADTLEASVL
jgi:hypothetical protein